MAVGIGEEVKLNLELRIKAGDNENKWLMLTILKIEICLTQLIDIKDDGSSNSF